MDDDFIRPATRAGIMSIDPNPQFDILGRCERITRELDPKTALEAYLVEEIAWGIARCMSCRGPSGFDQHDGHDETWWRSFDRGQKVLHRNLAALSRLIDRRQRAAAPRKAAKAEKPAVPLTPHGTPSHEAPLDTPIPTDSPEAIAEAAANWYDEIAYVPSFNNKWAVHLPTGLVIEHLICMEEDGVEDERMLRNERLLRPRDLAAMRACEAAGRLGPYCEHDPRPEGIRTLDALPPRRRNRDEPDSWG